MVKLLLHLCALTSSCFVHLYEDSKDDQFRFHVDFETSCASSRVADNAKEYLVHA